MAELPTRRDALKTGGAVFSGLAFAHAQGAKTYRACVIGHTGRGGYGHGLDTCFQKIPHVQVVAVADPDERGRAAAAKRIGVERSYADFREMLEKEKPDLVSHGMRWVERRAETIGAIAEAGAHVYMEKPMAASLEEADAIVAATERKKVKLSLAFPLRLSPPVVHLKKLLDEGFLGDLLEMRSRGKEDHRAGGEDMAVLGTHCVYLMRYFAGDPLWCAARVMEKGKEITAEHRRAATEPLGPVAGDSIQATYAFPRGVQGHFASQKGSHGPGGRFGVTLFGTKGAAHVNLNNGVIYHLAEPTWAPGKSPAAWQPLAGAPSTDDPASGLKGSEAANKRIVEDLLRAVESGGPSAVSAYDGRWVLEMLLGAYAAHLQGGRATFPLKDRRHPLGNL